MVLWSTKGDLEHFAKSLCLRHYGSNMCCELCPAHSDVAIPAMMWANLSRLALWKQRLFSKVQRLAIHPDFHCFFFRVFPFLCHHTLEPGELHVLYLGTLPLLLGSVLWLLCYRCSPTPPAETMEKIWAHITKYYSAHGTNTQFSALALNSCIDPARAHREYPTLKGKGAEIKDVAPAILDVWVKFRNPHTYEFDRVGRLLEHQ